MRADLTVILLQRWHRDLWMDSAGLPWINTSPNIYTGTTNVSSGATLDIVSGGALNGAGALNNDGVLIDRSLLRKRLDEFAVEFEKMYKVISRPGAPPPTAAAND